MRDQDRYLQKQAGRKVYTYIRNIPIDLRDVDSRSPRIVKSTGKKSIFEAREVRDVWEQADDQFWQALRDGLDANTARERYDAAIGMQRARRGTTLPTLDLLEIAKNPELIKRFDEAVEASYQAVSRDRRQRSEKLSDRQHAAAAQVFKGEVGLNTKPAMNVEEAFDYWINKCIRTEWQGKSREQHRQWRNPIDRSIKNWKNVVGGHKVFLDTSRDDALQYFEWLDQQVAKKEGGLDPKTANRYFGLVRRCWTEVAARHGLDVLNPFRDLGWKKEDKQRLANSTDWLVSVVLNSDAFASMNRYAFHIFLMCIETGCRPIEVCNIVEQNIHLDHNIPHIHITAMEGMPLKTRNSDRRIPLVGAALEAMRLHPQGFPRYYDRNNALTDVVNKYTRENKLRETPKHTIYSVRHTFKDRLRTVSNDDEMRHALMGHTDDHPNYGEGFSLEAKQEVLAAMALPFDPSIV